jgi:hypothetical protein
LPGGAHTGTAVPSAKRTAYFAARDKGLSKRQACKIAGISSHTALALERNLQELDHLPELGRTGPKPKRGRPAPTLAPLEDPQDYPYGPRAYNELTEDAQKAHADFGYFRRRYLGRGESPWQVEAAYQMMPLLESPDREFVCVNMAPGVGKSSLFSHDLPVWLIARNRRIRILIGSRTERQAMTYVNRIRQTLSRAHIARPAKDQLAQGLATLPEAVLSADFGRFKGLDRDGWTREFFTVAQHRGEISTEKEATCASFGMDSGVLGMRFDLIIWDDLVDSQTVGTPYAREKLIDWWEREAEARLDPGGLLILQGQRIDPNDLYRYALDQKAFDDEGNTYKKYSHIVYPAHFEDRCQGRHEAGAPSYPQGCLLDSYRLPWRELASHQQSRPEKYRILYQQEDSDPADAMVQRLWINGGQDPSTGEEFSGCWDHGRDLAQLPDGLTAPLHSVCVADPAPSRYWAIQWWLYEPATERRFLMDLVRSTMTAPQFLDWRQAESVFVGLMEDWLERSVALGVPIKHWIVEANAAQKFMLQYDHVKRWASTRSVALIPHNTHAVNKLDTQIGVSALGPHYRFGRVRLPAGDGALSPAHTASSKLVNEAVGWPSYATDDCLMAQWFLEVSIPRLFPKVGGTPMTQRRPSWTGSSRRRPLR